MVKEIKSTFLNRAGQTLEVVYREADPKVDLKGKILQAVHAFCFYKEQAVVVSLARGAS